MKLRLHEDSTDDSKIAELLRFNTSNSGDEQTNLKEYIDRMKEGQHDIHYSTGVIIAVVSSSLSTEILQKKGHSKSGDEQVFLKEYIDRVKERAQELIHERIVEEIVDIPVPQVMEEIIEDVKLIPQERLQNRTVQRIVDVPVLVIRKETDGVNQLILQERISDHADEHNVDIPSAHFQEQAVEAVKRVVDVREEANLHLEPYKRDATDGMRSRWKHPVDLAPSGIQHSSSVKRQQHGSSTQPRGRERRKEGEEKS